MESERVTDSATELGTPGEALSRGVETALVGAIFAVVAWMLLSSLPGPHDAASDDGYYVRFMTTVSQRGLGALPGLFERWNATREDWIFPPPSRVGFVVVSALWAKVFGASLDSLSKMSAVSHLVLVLVTWRFARRHFGALRAVAAVALVAFSPLLLGLARLALADSLTVLFASLAIWTYVDFVFAPRNVRRWIAFTVAFAAAMLVKELVVMLTLPFAAFAALEAIRRRAPRDLVPVAAALAVAGLFTVSLLVLAAGGVAPLAETVRITLESPKTNAYALRYGSGPWFRYVLDFLLLSPGPTLLAIGAIGLVLLRPAATERDRKELFLALVCIGLIAGLSFGTKNVRYAAMLEVAIRLLGASLLAVWIRPRTTRAATAVYACAILILCGVDWWTFRTIWVERGLYDPVTAALLAARALVPMK